MRHSDQMEERPARSRVSPGPFAYNPQVLSRGQRELKARAPGSWIRKAGGWLDRAAFKPATLPDDLVTAIALIPPIAAGLIIFKLPAMQMLAIAAAAGTLGLIAARVFMRGQSRHPGISVLLAPLFGVSLVGTGASFIVTIEVAVLAVVVDFLRAQYMPALRAQAGLLAYAVIALVTRGGTSAYVNPASGGAFPGPVADRVPFFSPGSSPYGPLQAHLGQ